MPCIVAVLTAEERATAREALAGVDSVDGKVSAGEIAGAVRQSNKVRANDEAIARLRA